MLDRHRTTVTSVHADKVDHANGREQCRHRGEVTTANTLVVRLGIPAQEAGSHLLRQRIAILGIRSRSL
jgi:hypothetical protein